MRAIVIKGGRVIDGNGGAPLDDGVIVVADGRIRAVGAVQDVPVPAGALVITAQGRTVMPGLIEGHAHVGGAFEAQRVLRLSLQRGITTVCGVDANLQGIELRKGIESGAVRGCARLVAGCVITCTNGHGKFRTADGPWEVHKAVREMVMAGADFIKTAASGGFYGQHETCVARNYTYEELAALADESHAWDKPVVVHCHTQPGLNNCIRAGIDQIHHGAFIDQAAVHGIKDKGLYYMPTLAVTCDRNIQALSDQPWQTKKMLPAQPIHRAGVRLAHAAGVKLCVGCDYPGTPKGWKIGDRTMFEMQELVRCGLTPMEAIVAATRTNAAAYGLFDELGTLAPGKKADLLIVTGNPLDDIGILYDGDNISLVMKDGVVESVAEVYKPYYRVREDQPPERAGMPE